jgi:hypothetical protein
MPDAVTTRGIRRRIESRRGTRQKHRSKSPLSEKERHLSVKENNAAATTSQVLLLPPPTRPLSRQIAAAGQDIPWNGIRSKKSSKVKIKNFSFPV